MLKAIFWDNDGILVDTEELYFQATRDVLAAAGVTIGAADYADVGLRQGRSLFDLARARLGDATIEALRAQRNERYADVLRAGVAPLGGVEAVLSALHGRVTMGVVTSSNPEHFEIIHRSTGLLRFFDFALTNRDYERTKPHPDGYLAALARCRLAPEACLAIEDSPRGVAAANAAGIRCIAVPRGLTVGGDFSAAYRVVESTDDLGPLLTALLERW
jgi:HAD superfamily hydrolase (TIGR01509 family)